jgi:predicted oxidoreductase
MFESCSELERSLGRLSLEVFSHGQFLVMGIPYVQARIQSLDSYTKKTIRTLLLSAGLLTILESFRGSNSLVSRVEEIAKKKGVSMSQIALAWLMTKDPVAAPIVGTTKMEHLTDMISTSFIRS